eukprot:s6829_g7.t1
MFCLLRSAIARVLHRCPQHTASCVSLVVIAVFGCFLGLAEHAPPRLDSAVITQLVVDFKANYPGEYLDGDAMPSVRLLSLVHKWFTPGNSIALIPWQLRLSQKQYQEIIESKSSKCSAPKHTVLEHCIVRRNAGDASGASSAQPSMAQPHPGGVPQCDCLICKGAHLARLKAFDKKILDWATQSPPDHSLRTVTTTELVAADRKLWQELSTMHSSGWTLDDALHEITTVQGKDKNSKGTGTSQASAKSQARAEVKATDLVTSQQSHLSAFAFTRATAATHSKYLHACAYKLPSGEPCGRNHRACRHKNPQEPGSS